MADRTSAEIFGNIFEMIAEKPWDGCDDFIEQVWRTAMKYDFSFYQMELNDKAVRFYMNIGYIKTMKDFSDSEETFEGYWLEDFGER